MTGMAGSTSNGISRFLALESAGGIALIAAAALAMALSNSPLQALYEQLLAIPIEVRIGPLDLAKPLLTWINDGLMAIFFLLVGLEIKREMLEGELSTVSQAALPVVAAIGGMAVPAAIYAFLNWGNAVALRGWAIPTATDIAFSLGALSLLGSRAPVSLKVFLTAVAIVDDVGAIVIIAAFYTDDLSLAMLLLGAAGTAVLAALNGFGVTRIAPYAAAGLFLWICVVKSGVHATLAGVVVGLAIPLRTRGGAGSPALRLEDRLHPWVAFGVLPLFAFANAGVSFSGVTLATLGQAIPLGIAAGLVLGKVAGVLGASAIIVGTGLARLPEQAGWAQMTGVSLLCGIGFTMSLFIGSLAFETAGPEHAAMLRVGVFAGSIVAAVLGYFVLRISSPSRRS